MEWPNNPYSQNGFPGSPLFCKFNEHDGLVGILLSNDVGGSKGHTSEFTYTQKNNGFGFTLPIYFYHCLKNQFSSHRFKTYTAVALCLHSKKLFDP